MSSNVTEQFQHLAYRSMEQSSRFLGCKMPGVPTSSCRRLTLNGRSLNLSVSFSSIWRIPGKWRRSHGNSHQQLSQLVTGVAASHVAQAEPVLSTNELFQGASGWFFGGEKHMKDSSPLNSFCGVLQVRMVLLVKGFR